MSLVSKNSFKVLPKIYFLTLFPDDTYSKDQILQMEKKIFENLGFNLSKPLPIHFMRRFAKAAGTLGDRQYIAAKYFMELATIDYELTKFKPSQVRNRLLLKRLSLKLFFLRSPPLHFTCQFTSLTP